MKIFQKKAGFSLTLHVGECARLARAVGLYTDSPAAALQSVRRRAQYLYDLLRVRPAYTEDDWLTIDLPEIYIRMLHISLEIHGEPADAGLRWEFWRPWTFDREAEYREGGKAAYTFLPPVGLD